MIAARQKLLQFVDDETYLFITTPEGGTLEVKELTYHTGNNSLEIKCGEQRTKGTDNGNQHRH